MIGRRFGKLVVVSETNERVSGQKMWLCRCDCGNFKKVNKGNLEHGNVKSCGCIVGKQNVKHGDSGNRIRVIWVNMMARCYNKNSTSYKRYGAKGVSVCKGWHDYAEFKKWAHSNGYDHNLTLDRFPISNGNYSPSNCRWATYKQQANNTKSNHILELYGIKKTISEWADYSGISQLRIRRRLLLGWSNEDAITKPINKSKISNRYRDVN